MGNGDYSREREAEVIWITIYNSEYRGMEMEKKLVIEKVERVPPPSTSPHQILGSISNVASLLYTLNLGRVHKLSLLPIILSL